MREEAAEVRGEKEEEARQEEEEKHAHAMELRAAALRSIT